MQVLFNGKPVPYKGVSPTEIQVTLDETQEPASGSYARLGKWHVEYRALAGQFQVLN
jgi:hypothetical protein